MAVTARFGNLTTAQFENKTQVIFSDEDRIWLEDHRTDTASYEGNDKFHIFNMPFTIYAGFDVYEELVKRLRKYDFEIQFTVEQKEADITPAS